MQPTTNNSRRFSAERSSASAWTLPFVLITIWGAAHLWLQDLLMVGLSKDLTTALIYSSVIASSLLPTINRATNTSIATGQTQHIIEDALGCILVVLSFSVLLSAALLSQSHYIRDPLHLATQLAAVALMAKYWILTTILLSSNQKEALINSVVAGGLFLFIAEIYQPIAGQRYHVFACLGAIATALLVQARAITLYLPRPSKISLSLVIGPYANLKLSLAGISLCLTLWLTRLSGHSTDDHGQLVRYLEDCQSVAYLILLPVAIYAWAPLERQFKLTLYSFRTAAGQGGDLSALDYQKHCLINLSLSGMQRLHIALISAAIVSLALKQLSNGAWSSLQGPNWIFPLVLVCVALQMVTLCCLHLLFFLQRDTEILAICAAQLVLSASVLLLGFPSENIFVFIYALVICNGIVCLISVWVLRYRLQQIDYLYFVGGLDAAQLRRPA